VLLKRGCASDDVYLCSDLQSVRHAFQNIHGSTVFGSPGNRHDHVLMQEFAVGQEFAIDTVSKNGQLKIAAIWQYDKRPANGAPFVYYATKLYAGSMDAGGENQNDNRDDGTMLGLIIYNYLNDCFRALDITWGMTHSEIIMTKSPDGTPSPRLVEVNCRQHNMVRSRIVDHGNATERDYTQASCLTTIVVTGVCVSLICLIFL
jgi:hypothetical protein